MAAKKISELTELTSANAATDFLPVVDTSAVETKKITLANLPLSDAAKDSAYPYTTDFQSGVEQTRNLTTIDSSSGFSYTSQPSSIYIGSNVTSLGNYAFSFSPLTSVIIPDSVTSIGTRAFFNCSSLTSATIGNSVTSIGPYSFSSCNSLTSITIGNSVTSIGSYAFAYCSSLATINCLATTAPTIGSNAFQAVAATDVHVPVGATYPATYGGLTVVFDL